MDLNKKPEKSTSAFAQIFLDKEARLSKKSWHYQLLKFSIGESMIPKYNFCPYFWLTIFSVIISPVLLPIKGFFKLLGIILINLLNYSNTFYEENITIPSKQRYAKNLETCPDNLFIGWLYERDEIYDVIGDFNKNNTRKYLLTNEEYSRVGDKQDYYKKFHEWKDATPDWQEKINAWKKEREENLEKRMQYYKDLEIKLTAARKLEKENTIKREAEAAKRQARIKNMMIKLGKILSVLLIIPVGFILYYVGIALIFISKLLYKLTMMLGDVETTTWYIIGKIFCIVILVLVAIYVLSYVYKAILTKIRELSIFKVNKCIKEESKPKKDSMILNVLYFIFKTIVWPILKFCNILSLIGNGIIDGMKFFVIFIKNWKSDNCPEIIWDDEDKK